VLDRERALQDSRNTVSERWKQLRESLLAQLARLRGDEYSLISIRKTYASLVRLASASGFPREQSQTPYEYVCALLQAFPENAPEIRLITEAYVRVHYGERSFPPHYVQRVREAWLSIVRHQQLSHPDPARAQ
jgi:hypothetical protein